METGMKFVLLDAEWIREKAGKREQFKVVQLSAVALNENLRKISSFHRIIWDETREPTKDIMQSMHLASEAFEHSVTFRDAWSGFAKWLPQTFCCVLWSQETPGILQKNCSWENVHNPIRDIIYTHQLFNRMLNIPEPQQFSFVKCCRMLGTACDESRLHNSAYDVSCLARLFRKLIREGMRGGEKHFYEGRYRKEFHTKECNIWKEASELTFLEAIYKGCSPCACCGSYFPEIRKKVRKKHHKEDVGRIAGFCRTHQYICRIHKDVVWIETKRGSWSLHLCEPENVIYHRNACPGKGRIIRCLPGDEKEPPMETALRTIREKEQRLEAGVGNALISSLLKELWGEVT